MVGDVLGRGSHFVKTKGESGPRMMLREIWSSRIIKATDSSAVDTRANREAAGSSTILWIREWYGLHNKHTRFRRGEEKPAFTVEFIRLFKPSLHGLARERLSRLKVDSAEPESVDFFMRERHGVERNKDKWWPGKCGWRFYKVTTTWFLTSANVSNHS